MTENITDIIRDCDSWSKVEDQGDALKEGRFAITVFFDTEEQARKFYGHLVEITTRP